MKRKAIVTVLFLAVFSVSLVVPSSSWAGSPQSHRWEGVAIGIGSAIIGSALLKTYQEAPPAPTHRPRPAVRVHYQPPPPPQPAGYWQIQKQWVPPTYQKVWHPGYSKGHGRKKVPGQWIETEVQPGYWVQTQVWVPRY